jgi:hypothetical protein
LVAVQILAGGRGALHNDFQGRIGRLCSHYRSLRFSWAACAIIIGINSYNSCLCWYAAGGGAVDVAEGWT